jgi:hypothetical protein
VVPSFFLYLIYVELRREASGCILYFAPNHIIIIILPPSTAPPSISHVFARRRTHERGTPHVFVLGKGQATGGTCAAILTSLSSARGSRATGGTPARGGTMTVTGGTTAGSATTTARGSRQAAQTKIYYSDPQNFVVLPLFLWIKG